MVATPGPDPDATPGESTDGVQPDSVDTGPIDVHELLETTRKLFDSDEISDALERAGFGALDEPRSTPSLSPDTGPDTEVIPPVGATSEPSSPHESVDDESQDDEGEVSESRDDTTTSRRGINLLAIASLVLAFTLSPLALVFGYIALGQTRRAGQRGEALALWGIGLGWLVFAAWAVAVGSIWWIAANEGITFDALGELVDFLRIP